MKKIYIYNNSQECEYFSNLKALHEFAKSQTSHVHKTFATFKKWISEDGRYDLNISGSIFCEIREVKN